VSQRTSPAQLAFSAGEIAPLLHRRSDYQRFQTGLARCNGFIPLRQGGVTRAPGTILRGKPKANARAWLVDFEFAADDALTLEFTPNVMRVWRYGELVLDGSDPFELATPYDADDLPHLWWLQSADVIYLCDGRQPVQELKRFDLDDWTIAAAVFENGPFRNQNLDTALTISPSAASGTITLTASAALFEANHVGSLLSLRPTDVTSIALWTGNTALSMGDLVRYQNRIYQSTDPTTTNTGVNPPVHSEGTQRYGFGGPNWLYISDDLGIVRITAVASSTSATATVLRRIPAPCVTTASYRWAEGAWSDRYGYPSVLEFIEQRLAAAATETDPRTTWFSTIGAFRDFEPGVEADSSFAYEIAGVQSVNSIQWLAPGRTGLHLGGLSEEYSARASANNEPFGPTTAVFGRDSTIGSQPVRPIVPDGRPIFVSKDGARVFEIAYSFQADANQATELSLPSSHLGKPGFQQIVWQSAPLRLAWLRRGDGTLAVMVYDPAEQVLGWAPLSIAGGFVESLSVTPDATGSRDVLTMCVRRTIDEAEERFIEELAIVWGVEESSEDIAEACHLYCCLEHIGSAEDTFDLSHLVGETVFAWTDKGQFGPYEVPGDGEIVLPEEVTRAFIGLFDETHAGETLDIQAAAPDGSSLGRKKRLSGKIGVGAYRTAAGRLRTVEKSLGQPDLVNGPQDIVPRQVAAELSQAFSGVGRIDAPTGHAEEVRVRFEPVGGAPMTLTAIVPMVQEAGA
jgi:hypothetical protein